MTEADLYEQVEKWIATHYPSVLRHWDLSGVWTPSHKIRNLYGRLNGRGWPDLLILKPVSYEGIWYPGLALELKRDGTKIYKKDGTPANEHVAEQLAAIARLREEGYIADITVGFDETVETIGSYLGQPTNLPEGSTTF